MTRKAAATAKSPAPKGAPRVRKPNSDKRELELYRELATTPGADWIARAVAARLQDEADQ